MGERHRLLKKKQKMCRLDRITMDSAYLMRKSRTQGRAVHLHMCSDNLASLLSQLGTMEEVFAEV